MILDDDSGRQGVSIRDDHGQRNIGVDTKFQTHIRSKRTLNLIKLCSLAG